MEEDKKTDETINETAEATIVEKEEVVNKDSPPQDKKNKKEKKDKVLELESKIKELEDKVLRVQAEAINYKKRVQTDQATETKYAKQDLISKLIPNLDLFKNVLAMDTKDPMLKGFLAGFKMIQDNLFSTLYDDGLKDIQAENEIYNPKYHDCIDKIRDPNILDMKIVSVKQKGYLYKDRVLQVAKVVINDLSLIELSEVQILLEEGKIKDVNLFNLKSDLINDKPSDFLGREYIEHLLKEQLLRSNYLITDNTTISTKNVG
jgi:molecular chaperone GrpE